MTHSEMITGTVLLVGLFGCFFPAAIAHTHLYGESDKICTVKNFTTFVPLFIIGPLLVIWWMFCGLYLLMTKGFPWLGKMIARCVWLLPAGFIDVYRTWRPRRDPEAPKDGVYR